MPHFFFPSTFHHFPLSSFLFIADHSPSLASSSTSSDSSSSSGRRRWTYDVFLNFRGEDTRRSFVSHLYRALDQKAIHTFIDAEELRKGNHLSDLLTAIRNSRVSIVVFPPNYASSTWCLKELVQILECMDSDGQTVVPVFYDVDPSHVRKRKRSFAEAFARHELDSAAEMAEVQSWNICQLKSLKDFNLVGCSNLEKFPEISEVMEELNWLCLDETAIEELPSSISNLTGLYDLSLEGCLKLKSLPCSICQLKSLQCFILAGCSNLEKFPEISEVMGELQSLHLDETVIEELPSSISNLTGLCDLSLACCLKLKHLPCSICQLKSLKDFNLAGCSNLEKFPEISEVMGELQSLRLDETAIEELPSSISNLTRLCYLSLEGWLKLKRLPCSICQLKSLQCFILAGCSNLEKFPEISEVMEELNWLCLDETAIEELPSSISNLTGLCYLSLEGCLKLKSLPCSIDQLKSLRYTFRSDCPNLETQNLPN
ncbi:hypothetical protein DVH24_000844 [Malus domestica]|uniref:TIR domain-containing protein n=1 Tax=Malus domestica TaxID=3750 RepID=A0A498JXJ5_MALDO|nr:hypothetical protein DVH24_000844 [Malus domestica]